MPDNDIPAEAPHRIAGDTWLISNRCASGPGAFVPMNSMVIRGAQPVVVDTGTPLHRDSWFAQVESLVDLDDVRWIFISHDDSDHVGNLHELLDRCPHATLVANFFMNERMAVEPRPLPLHRMRWLEAGDALDVGDRRLHLVTPPLYDGPTTRGLYDERTAVLWAVDAFASMTPAGVCDAVDVPAPMYDETFRALNSMVAPWHELVEPARFRRHCDRLEALGLVAVASAHGPVLHGDAIPDAFERIRGLAGAARVQPPGQPLLDQIVAGMVAA
ncbi:MAG TPA: MBL fold metallo-hydrolase [Mycobacteriales bacterium]|jgi:flavorubredoxin|nr:MBL fold metallo-hydrolase [Mycobacteriales bacterium]